MLRFDTTRFLQILRFGDYDCRADIVKVKAGGLANPGVCLVVGCQQTDSCRAKTSETHNPHPSHLIMWQVLVIAMAKPCAQMQLNMMYERRGESHILAKYSPGQ